MSAGPSEAIPVTLARPNLCEASARVLFCYSAATNSVVSVLLADVLESQADGSRLFATPWTVWPVQLPLLIPRWRDRDSHGPLNIQVRGTFGPMAIRLTSARDYISRSASSVRPFVRPVQVQLAT